MFWDLNLCMEYNNKILVPFHYYGKPHPQLIPPPVHHLFPFFRLPVDLQLIVYEHCDAPTLFQLMRTCSRSRHAATKLFWEGTFTNTWYHCPDYWLFKHKTPGYIFTRHCSEFAQRITNIEIDLIRLELRFQEDGEWHNKRFRASTVMKAKVFWAKVEKVFPSVKRMVLTGCTPERPNPPPAGASDENYACIGTVLRYAPAQIEVYIAFIAFPNNELDRAPRNTLWQVSADPQPVWRVLDQDWKPTRVLLPVRKWNVSPLGDYQTFNRRFHSVVLEMRGVQWLMIESYARYAVQDIIHCPHLDCSMTFKQKDLWKHHLSESGHGRFDIRLQSEKDPMLELLCYKYTPKVEKLAIEARQQRLDAQYLEAAKIQRRVGHGWGPSGSEQREWFEQEIKAQMQEESLFTPEEPAPGRESPADEYLNNLHMCFSRGHVYHACSGPGKEHICYED
jgi:hypothetical protein